MKRKLLILLVAVLSLLTLASCGDNGDSGKNDPPVQDGTLIYEEGTTLRVIRPDGDTETDINALTSAITKATGRMPGTFYDTGDAISGEIVVGDTNRQITAYLKEYVDSLDIVSNDVAVWCIYSYGGSVAIWWSHDIPDIIDGALSYFIDNYLDESSLYLKDGVVHQDTFDRRAYEDAREAALRESQLDEIEAELGKEARDAIEDYLGMYTDRYYEWLANLYDPGVGGFYYSNSGRDNEGFLPDVESTMQALSWISGVGMLEQYPGGLKEAIPEWMQEQLVAFAKSLQSPEDGYFYHPQWGTSISVSRRGRDLGWGTQIITTFGYTLPYDAPNGTKGDKPIGGASAITERLGGSAASAVSKIVASSTSSLPSYLKDPEGFRTYLESFNWAENSYSAGNTVGSQSAQILNAGDAYVKVFEEVLNKHQEIAQEKLRDAAEAEAKAKNPSITAEELADVRAAAENGLWEDRVSYDSVNGLMKISGTYNSLKVKLPYADKALVSAVTMTAFTDVDVEGKVANNAVDVYNPWVSISNCLTNIKNFYDPELVPQYRAIVTDRAAELITITKNKVAIFAKDDGSFGYNEKKVPSKSQGAAVAIEGTNEGDINGGSIATNGTFRNMCTALGIIVPYRYFNSDFENFMAIIEKATPVKKVPIVAETEPVTFDDDAVGSIEPNRIVADMGVSANGAGSVEVIEDKREGATGNVLRAVTLNGAGSTITTKPIGTGVGNCLVLEWDMNIEQSNNNTVVYQIRLGDAYMFTVTTKGTYYTFGDSSSTNGQETVTNNFDGQYSYGQWYTVRIEHYTGNADEIKNIIYVDGKVVGTSDNFYGKPRPDAISSSVPNDSYTVARFFNLKSSDLTVLLDNIRAEKISKAYTAPDGTDTEKPEETPFNGTLDLEGSTSMPSNVVFTDNGLDGSQLSIIADPTVAEGSKANNVFKFSTTGAPVGGSGNTLSVDTNVKEGANPNCYVASADFYFKSMPNTVATQFYIKNGTGNNIYCVNMDFRVKDGKTTLRIYEKPEGDKTSATIVDWFDVTDSWVNIRMEYYKDQNITKFYINDVCVAENGAYWNDTNAQKDYTRLSFFALRATTCEIYIDNIVAKSITKAYEPMAAN